MKVLLLGGTGIMGVPLANILAGRGIDVDVTTRQERSPAPGIRYVRGNAHNGQFLRSALQGGRYDAIVDFMIYETAEFQKRIDLLLNSTKHYLFLSSCNVFADSERPLTENSDRLLDVCTDAKVLKPDCYALAKARQEDLLNAHPARNWTIIRPYITYCDTSLRLGFHQKEDWLFRALHGRPFVFFKDVAARTTTHTRGEDVAYAIAALIGREETQGLSYNITGTDCMTWGDVLELYLKTIVEETGRMPAFYLLDRPTDYDLIWYPDSYKYDRLCSRKFDNSRISAAVKDFNPLPMREGLERCMREFLRNHLPYKHVDWPREAHLDRMFHCRTPLREIPPGRFRRRYFTYRYFPSLAVFLYDHVRFKPLRRFLGENNVRAFKKLLKKGEGNGAVS